MSKLNVFYEQIKVGELLRDEELVYSFLYSKDWLEYEKKFPLSLALPFQEQAFGNKAALSFFENLLPEGEVRKVIEQTQNIAGTYDFLKEFGADCSGAVIVTQSEVSPFSKATDEKIEIDIARVYEAIDKNHSVAHVIAKMDPGYLSLAGAQDKFPAIYENGKFYLPSSGGPTTHIVKVPIQRSGVKESVYNEYYCMQLAKACGFEIPFCEIQGDGHHPLFVIERYDREIQKSGRVQRLHQQDFCQAQGIISEHKYENRGGPSIKDNYDLIVESIGIKKRASSVYQFLDWICFNLLIGNNDSHSKNISILLKDNKVELAPFYDLISTALYPGLKREFSFMIGDRDDYSRIGKKQFDLLNEKLGLKAGSVEERMQKVSQELISCKDGICESILKEHKEAKIPKRISELIDERVKSLERQGLKLR